MAEDKRVLTYETLVFDRIFQAIHAKDVKDGALFDEVIEEIEMFLKLLPDVYNSYVEKRERINENLDKVLSEIQAKAEKIEDDLVRATFLSQQQSTVFWDYRNDLLEAILETLNEYQLIPFMYPPTARILEEHEAAEIIEESENK